jgi:hypothetical protein
MPSDFQLAFKGTDEITIKKFPNLPRYGHRAGVVNENFLNAEFFSNTFLRLSFFQSPPTHAVAASTALSRERPSMAYAESRGVAV